MPSAELDIENRAALERYLKAQFSPAEDYEVREYEILTGGVSGRTVRVSLSGGQEWVLKQALPKLRVEADWFADPRRIHREALGMKVLAELTPPGSIPKLIFDDETHHVLGMEAVPRPHENWKTMLLRGDIEPRRFTEFGALLGVIHYHGWQERKRLELAFSDRTFFEALRLEPYYEYSATREPEAAVFLRTLLADTRAVRTTIVHGDYSPKNVLIHAGRLVLLDHEVIHWGDPGFDFGFAMTHILAKSLHLQEARRPLIGCAHLFLAEYLDVYCSSPVAAGSFDHSLTQRCVRHTLGCLLARVVGRSPLEYLTAENRARLREATLRLIRTVPNDLPDLVERFLQEIER